MVKLLPSQGCPTKFRFKARGENCNKRKDKWEINETTQIKAKIGQIRRITNKRSPYLTNFRFVLDSLTFT